MCKFHSNGTVGLTRYYNNGKSPTADSETGFTNITTSYVNNVLKCSFTRAKAISSVTNSFDLNNQYYLLTAYGLLSTSETLTRHINKIASSSQFNFLVDGEYSSNIINKDNLLKPKVHGCLMIFAWLLCASTGILFARYYKFIFPKKQLLGVEFWFFVHRTLMISVPIITLSAFLVILSDLNWKWIAIESGNPVFLHSIIGITTLSFSFVQV